MAKELNAETLQEELQNKQIVVVDFNAAWCGPCKTLGPIVDALATELNEDAQVSVVKVDVDANKDLAVSHNVRGIPTVIFFKDGQPVDRQSGLMSKDQIVAKIDSLR